MMNEYISMLEWVGANLGMAGAVLLCVRCKYSAYGWVLFLVSNMAWIGFALINNIHGLSTQHIVFMGTSLIGIYRWLYVERKPAGVVIK